MEQHKRKFSGTLRHCFYQLQFLRYGVPVVVAINEDCVARINFLQRFDAPFFVEAHARIFSEQSGDIKPRAGINALQFASVFFTICSKQVRMLAFPHADFDQ